MKTANLNMGERFGRLVIGWLEYVHVTPGGKRKPMMACHCDCGGFHVASLYDIRSGRTSSCGCLHDEVAQQARHGAARRKSHTPEYRAWRSMLTRGLNPNIKRADRYVMRGITVCDEWLPGGDGKGFERFLAHVGTKPSPKHSLDRINNDDGYRPGNVRWATAREQVLNRSRA